MHFFTCRFVEFIDEIWYNNMRKNGLFLRCVLRLELYINLVTAGGYYGIYISNFELINSVFEEGRL